MSFQGCINFPLYIALVAKLHSRFVPRPLKLHNRRPKRTFSSLLPKIDSAGRYGERSDLPTLSVDRRLQVIVVKSNEVAEHRGN